MSWPLGIASEGVPHSSGDLSQQDEHLYVLLAPGTCEPPPFHRLAGGAPRGKADHPNRLHRESLDCYGNGGVYSVRRMQREGRGGGGGGGGGGGEKKY